MARKTQKVQGTRRVYRHVLTMTMDVECVMLLDACVNWMQQTSDNTKKVTRSSAMRLAVETLHSSIQSRERKKKEYTET